MNLLRSKNKISRRHGQALIEFILFIPFLIVFIFAIVEYGNMFMTALRVSNLSREVANAAYRDCVGLNGSQLDTCLDNIVAKVSSQAVDVLNDFGSRGQITVSVYDDPNPAEPSNAARFVAKQPPGGSSHYSAAEIDIAIINTMGVIAIGEVFYDYVPITPIQSLLGVLGIPAQIYEVTIY